MVIAYHVRVSLGLVEICMGVVVGYIATNFVGGDLKNGNAE